MSPKSEARTTFPMKLNDGEEYEITKHTTATAKTMKNHLVRYMLDKNFNGFPISVLRLFG